MAYVFGFIVADGCVCGPVITITNKEKFLLENTRRFMGVENPIYDRTYRSKNRPVTTGYALRVGSKKMVGDLARLGVTERKSKTIRFPHVPDEYLTYFLQGLIDGDGSIFVANAQVTAPLTRKPPIRYRRYHYKVLEISIASGSLEFLADLKKIVPLLHGNHFHVSAKGRKAVELGTWIYEDTLVHSRKHQNFVNAYTTVGGGYHPVD